jgi:hypothetical protein
MSRWPATESCSSEMSSVGRSERHHVELAHKKATTHEQSIFPSSRAMVGV